MAMPRGGYQRHGVADLSKMAERGDRLAAWELARRDRLDELKRAALAEPVIWPDVQLPKIKKG